MLWLPCCLSPSNKLPEHSAHQRTAFALAAHASVDTASTLLLAAPRAPVDPDALRRQRAEANPLRFCLLALQLTVLLGVVHRYQLQNRLFEHTARVMFLAFLIHYWLPFRLKERFLVVVSMAAPFYLLDPSVAALLIVVGVGIFGIFRLPLSFRLRSMLAAFVFAILMYGNATRKFPIPATFYALFGAIFMFRIIIYVYDLAHSREPARLLPFLSYFYILPNYCFALFPVIDFQTMRRTYYQRDTHEIAQQGIQWMTRGLIQLLLYRLIFYWNDQFLPDQVTSLGALFTTIVLTYLLYLNVSGQFHFIVGMLHLFGYDLPETNRRYLLARSLNDFWRRINIYWKDFMVKIVYFPVYFRLRKTGDLRAQVTATAAVFLVTWILHAYQSFWLIGQWTFRWTDTIFWTILGLLVVANVLYDARHRRRIAAQGWQPAATRVAQTVGTFLLMSTLWSFWASPSISSWTYLMTHWTRSTP